MTATVAATTTDRTERPWDRRYTLDELSRMNAGQLTNIYREGRLPNSLHALDGAPAGRALAVTGPLGRLLLGFTRRLSAASWFPWAGKSFSAETDDEGWGINRVRLLGERQWFRFETRLESSALDGRPCILLDYEQPDNPWLIRKIRDELREVSPGLFLGPALWKGRNDAQLILFFAIDTAG